MNAIIQQFQNELSPVERLAFEARAARAGRLPGAHLKCILFSDQASAEAAGPVRKWKSKPAIAKSAPALAGEGKRRRTLRK